MTKLQQKSYQRHKRHLVQLKRTLCRVSSPFWLVELRRVITSLAWEIQIVIYLIVKTSITFEMGDFFTKKQKLTQNFTKWAMTSSKINFTLEIRKIVLHKGILKTEWPNLQLQHSSKPIRILFCTNVYTYIHRYTS